MLTLAIPGLAPKGAGPQLPLRHSVGPAGDVYLLFPRDAAAVRSVAADGAELAAVLEVTALAPAAAPDRVRGRAWLAGWLTAVPGGGYEDGTELLRLEPGEIVVADRWGSGEAEPDDFADATPEPLPATR